MLTDLPLPLPTLLALLLAIIGGCSILMSQGAGEEG